MWKVLNYISTTDNISHSDWRTQVCLHLLPYSTVVCIVYKTELSPSLTTFIYLTPCIASDCWKPAAIMSASIAVEDLLQFLKHMCYGGGELCFCPVKMLLQDLARKGRFFLHPCKILQDPAGSCGICGN